MPRRWVNSSHDTKSTYASWAMMKRRCYNPEDADYPNYGGRGISVCESWRDNYDNFVFDMGLKPEGMTLERGDTDGDYGPDNCVWATREQQANNRRTNRRLVYLGEGLTVAQWARKLNVTRQTLLWRLDQNLNFREVFHPGRRIAEVAEHGTVSRYTSSKFNCRCEKCREAWRNYAATRRKRV